MPAAPGTPGPPGSPAPDTRRFDLPNADGLGVRWIENAAGLRVGVLPNGGLFAIEHRHGRGATMINQVLGSPIDGGIGGLFLRDRRDGRITPSPVGPGSTAPFAVAADRFTWSHDRDGCRCRCSLQLHPDRSAWAWVVEVQVDDGTSAAIDLVVAQDLGLGGRGFLMNNEAYASQYIDAYAAEHARFGHVLMFRQNLSQGGRHPWLVMGCVPRCVGFATDAIQFFGPSHRGTSMPEALVLNTLPSEVMQHEAACAAVQTAPVEVEAGRSVRWGVFALYEPDHPAASSGDDLAAVDAIAAWAERLQSPPELESLQPPVRSLPYAAIVRNGSTFNDDALDARYGEDRRHGEYDGGVCSFFRPDGLHVVTCTKEMSVTRRTGHLIRTGGGMLPDERTMCVTAWMHGVFGAQLTLGNTSFHKLFSVSRDPYNAIRSNGLRIMVKGRRGWFLLGVPSAFEMGVSGCRWSYSTGFGTIGVTAIASGSDPAIRWSVECDGEPLELLIFAHLVLGERELENGGRVEIDAANKRFTFRPSADWLWGQKYPQAVYHLVTATPDAVDAIGGDELLFVDGEFRGTPHVALRTKPTRRFEFAVVGSLTDPAEAERLAAKYAQPLDEAAMLDPAEAYWRDVTRSTTLAHADPVAAALDTTLPWYAHNAMVHLTVPHGLEQYTGAAWGTRDVCQGPLEFLLALDHHDAAKAILRKVFAQQYAERGDWPQWFMLEPYSFIQDPHSHGDVIVWPLKALCDYLETTNDLAFLDEPIPYRREDNFETTDHRESVHAHVEKLLATVRERFIPGTHLIRYGEGDWNDALQPADPALRDTMVSSWTVALLYQQLQRYAEALRRADRGERAAGIDALAATIREEFNEHLIRDGQVAGYAIFAPGRTGNGGEPEYLLHPRDRRTGIRCSLLPMTRSIIGGLFTPEQARHHLSLIREHLLFPDGVRLMDRPPEYRGGIERIFRRAESSPFFGREVGLQYVHAHLRYAEALAALGEADALLDALLVVNPIAVTELLDHASPRQRNAYFSSSDAAFRTRYEASAQWDRLKRGAVAVEGGWRIYSSGPGIYVSLVLRRLLGVRPWYDRVVIDPVLPARLRGLALRQTIGGRRREIVFDAPPGDAPPRVDADGVPLQLSDSPSPYRSGAGAVERAAFEAAAARGAITIRR